MSDRLAGLRLDIPVRRRHESHAFALTIHDQARRRRLDATGAERGALASAADLAPQNGRHVPAIEAVENAAGDATVWLPEDASQRGVRVSDDGAWVSFAMEGLDGAPRVQDASATYAQAGAADRVVYEASSAGVKDCCSRAARAAK